MNLCKKLLNSVLFILMMNCSENSKNLVGEWKSEIRGYQTFDLVFKDSENLIYTAGIEVVGGKNYTIGGDKVDVKYEIDYSKKPIWLDIVFYEKDENKERVRVKYIIEFLTENKMLIAGGDYPESRPKSFEKTTNTSSLILNKVP